MSSSFCTVNIFSLYLGKNFYCECKSFSIFQIIWQINIVPSLINVKSSERVIFQYSIICKFYMLLM